MTRRSRMLGYEGQAWVAYFWFVRWDCFSLGFHVSLAAPNMELHLPFGFIRIGRRSEWKLQNCQAQGWSCFSLQEYPAFNP